MSTSSTVSRPIHTIQNHINESELASIVYETCTGSSLCIKTRKHINLNLINLVFLNDRNSVQQIIIQEFSFGCGKQQLSIYYHLIL